VRACAWRLLQCDSSLNLCCRGPSLSVCRYGGYIQVLADALAAQGLTNVSYFNRGINGGFVKDIRDGYENMTGFNVSLQQDQSTVVLIFIGTNDVWFPDSPRHSDPDPFAVSAAAAVAVRERRWV
jgi:lysophospholipase L1-like esterase